MPISKDKTRTVITIPKELKKQLEDIAKKDNRSFIEPLPLTLR
jgi:metal-responsive CopG/Arc/MetJ family transcriptional regulator